MKIYIHYKTTQRPWGGGNSFIKALTDVLKSGRQCEIISDINADYDIFLLNGGYKAAGRFINTGTVKNIKSLGYSNIFLRLVNGKKKTRKKIVYRLDGLRRFYAGIESRMDEIQLNCVKYADFIIFQSKDSLESFQREGFDREEFLIVRNGVDQNIFNLMGKKFWDGKRKLKIFSCSWSNNLNKGHQSIADASMLDFAEVNFAGNWAKGVNPKKVKLIPPQNAYKLSQYYKDCDVFLYPAKNDPCPNVVLEALSCGLPVIYHNSGGTPEIAADYGVALTDIKESILDLKVRYFDLVTRIKRDSYRFSIEYAGQQYLDVFRKVCEKD